MFTYHNGEIMHRAIWAIWQLIEFRCGPCASTLAVSGRQSQRYDIRDVGSASSMLPADNDNLPKAPGPLIEFNS
jgi:hypothetical protein